MRQWCWCRQSQREIADDLGLSSPTVCSLITKFIQAEGNRGILNYCYGDERKQLASRLLAEYEKRGGGFSRPEQRPPPVVERINKALCHARLEHAWLLRAEGLKLREIGDRLGIGKDRVRQLIAQMGRRASRAMRHSKIYLTTETKSV